VIETTPETPSGEGLVRAISRWGLAALTVNCIIGSGVFGLPAVLAEKAGRSSILAVLLGGVAIGVVIACFAEVASRFAETGGPYLYAREAFGRFMGIQVAWLVFFVRLTSCAANADLFVTYLGFFWPGATRALARVTILTLLIGVLALVNVRGVRAGARVSTTFTIAKLLSLGIIAAAGAWWLISVHRIVPPGGASPNADSWLQAIVLLIFAYGGFEAALISTGEARDPRRDVPFGLFAALLTCTLIYACIQWVVVGVLPNPGASVRPLADVARIVIGQGGAALITVGALVSIYGYLSGNILATPRITFALAERGDFPSPFALVHARFRTPYFSIVTFALLVWLCVGRQLYMERHTLRRFETVLLRRGLCRASGSAEKERKQSAFSPSRRTHSRFDWSWYLFRSFDPNRLQQICDLAGGGRDSGLELAHGPEESGFVNGLLRHEFIA